MWFEQQALNQPIFVENKDYRSSGYIIDYIKAIKNSETEQDFWAYLLKTEHAELK